jgi:hypothetical protein
VDGVVLGVRGGTVLAGGSVLGDGTVLVAGGLLAVGNGLVLGPSSVSLKTMMPITEREREHGHDRGADREAPCSAQLVTLPSRVRRAHRAAPE